MKQLIYIAFGALLLWGCGAQHGEADTATAEATEDRAAATDEMAPITTQEQPYAPDPEASESVVFEARAKQKLEDLFSYLEVVSDPEIDAEFRAQAQEMVSGLLVSDSVLLDSLPLCNTDTSLQWSQMAKNLNTAGLQRIQINSVHSAELIKVSESHYRGSLLVELSNTCGNSQRTSRATVRYHIDNVEKAFGDETSTVWEVRLGSIVARQ